MGILWLTLGLIGVAGLLYAFEYVAENKSASFLEYRDIIIYNPLIFVIFMFLGGALFLVVAFMYIYIGWDWLTE